MTPRPALLVAAAVVALGGALWMLGSLRESAPPDGPAGGASVDADAPDRIVATPDPAESGASAGLAAVAKRAEDAGSLQVRALRGHDRSAVDGARATVTGTSAAKTFVSRGAATDRAGFAGFDGVPAGEAYVVRVEAAGEAAVEREPVVVRAGQETTVEIFVAAHGEIDGRVIDEARLPVENVSVAATLDYDTFRGATEDVWPPFGAAPSALAFATTTKDGEFRFGGLPSGIVALRAAADGYRLTVDRVRIPGGPSNKADPAVLMLRRGRALAGIVVDGDDKGIAGAVLDLGKASGWDPQIRASITTSSDGRFRLGGFGPEDLNLAVRISAAGHPTVFLPSIGPPKEDLRIRLAGDARLAIAVFDDRMRIPVAGARLRVEVVGAKAPPAKTAPAWWEATTDARGEATLELSAGRLSVLEFSHPQYRTARIPAQPPSPREPPPPITWTGDLATPIASGETRQIVLHPRRGLTLSGKLAAPDGAPIPHPTVRVAYRNGSPGLSGRADEPGLYRVDGVLPDPGPLLVVEAPGFRAVSLPVDLRYGNRDRDFLTMDVTLEPSGLGDPAKPGALPKTWTLEGRVLDSKGSAVCGAHVTPAPRLVLTRSDGSYAIDLPTGSVKASGMQVTAVADGYLAAATPWFPVAPQVGGVVKAPDLYLTQGESIIGTVFAPDGSPLALALVETGRDMLNRSTVSGPDGRFALHALFPGTYPLKASAPDCIGWTDPLQVRTGALPLSTEIRMYAVVTVTGRVQTPPGVGIPKAKVLVDSSDPEGQARAFGLMDPLAPVVTDADGAFTIRALQRRHAYTAEARGYETSTIHLTTEPGPVVFTLKPVGR